MRCTWEIQLADLGDPSDMADEKEEDKDGTQVSG